LFFDPKQDVVASAAYIIPKIMVQADFGDIPGIQQLNRFA